MEGTIAVITPWAGNFEPLYWRFCQGQIMSIAENEALFSLIGTTFGGDGMNTFALPDLRSRVAVGTGNGSGIGTFQLGQASGTETNTITNAEMAMHTHPFSVDVKVPVNADGSGTANPQNAYPASTGGNAYNNVSSGALYGGIKASATTGIAGGGSPVSNIQPVLGVNYIICVEGIYPSRP